MSPAKRFVLIVFVLLACVGCDQTTKSMARTMLPESESRSYLGDMVRLQLTYNDGGFLSLGSSLPEPLRKAVFTLGVGFLLMGSLAYAFLANPGYPPAVLAMALVFSGGVGNLIDRLAFDGAVVDFINLGIGPLRTGIFNVADIAITAGAVILLWASFRRDAP